jgi:predicted nucleic acid-binding protein
VEYPGKSDDLPSLREVFLYLGECGALLGGARQIRLIIDTNVVVHELSFHARSKRNPEARTHLQEVIASGTVVAFAPENMRAEIAEKLPILAAKWRISLSQLRAEWDSYLPLLNFCAASALEVHQEGADFDALRQRDPNDIPFLAAAQAVGATAVLTYDKDFGSRGTRAATPDIVVDLRDYARAKVVALQIKAGGGLVAIPLTGAFVGMGKGLVALGRLIANAPSWLKVLLLGGSILLFLHPKSRSAIFGGVRKARGVAADFIDTAAPIMLGLMEEVRRAEEIAGAAWSRSEGRLPESRRATLRQLTYAVCVAAGRPLTAEQIQRKVLAHGYAPKGPGHKRYLQRVLRDDPRLDRGNDRRWRVRREGAVPPLGG